MAVGKTTVGAAKAAVARHQARTENHQWSAARRVDNERRTGGAHPKRTRRGQETQTRGMKLFK